MVEALVAAGADVKAKDVGRGGGSVAVETGLGAGRGNGSAGVAWLVVRVVCGLGAARVRDGRRAGRGGARTMLAHSQMAGDTLDTLGAVLALHTHCGRNAWAVCVFYVCV